MYLCMYAYVMAEFCMHFLASLRNKEKNAVFAIIAIWWGRGGLWVYMGWVVNGEKYFSMPTY